jgi:hypothetical protein
MRSHRRSQLLRSLAAGLAVTALAAPAASARPMLDPGSGEAPPTDTAPVTVAVDDGIDWGSAAIGAGGAGMLLLLAAGGATYASHGRRRVPGS